MRNQICRDLRKILLFSIVVQTATFEITVYAQGIHTVNNLNSIELLKYLKKKENYDFFIEENKKIISLKDNYLTSNTRMGVESKSTEVKAFASEQYDRFIKDNCFFIFPNDVSSDVLIQLFEERVKTDSKIAFGNGFVEFNKIISKAGCLEANKLTEDNEEIAPASGADLSPEYLDWWEDIRFVE